MDYIYLTGLTVKEISKQSGKKMPRICYLCKRQEGELSFGHIKEESGKTFFNRPKIDLGKIEKKISDNITSVYLMCTECAVLLGMEKDIKFEKNGE